MKILLLLISGIAWGACASPPYANGYSFCREITIDHTKVTFNLTNFPMVVCLGTTMGSACSPNSKELATAANGGKLLNSSGYDFIFTSDNAGTTPIAYERVIQNLTTGDSELWVLIGSLSSSVDTNIYLFYTNGSVSTDQSNPTAVWDANYKAVNHFNQFSGVINTGVNTGVDSTSVGNNLVLDGVVGVLTGGSGKIGAGVVWAATGGLLDPAVTGMPTGSATRTLEIWVNTSDSGSSQTAICLGTNAAAARFALGLVPAPNQWIAALTSESASFPATTTGGWHHFAITLPGGATTLMGVLPYVDGTLQTLSNRSAWTTTVATAAGDYMVGETCGLGGAFVLMPGAIADESRVSNIARSSDWIATEYNNESSPNTFYSISQQTPPDASAGRTIIIN